MDVSAGVGSGAPAMRFGCWQWHGSQIKKKERRGERWLGMRAVRRLYSYSPSHPRGEISPYRDPQRLFHEDMGESVKDSLNLCFSSLLGVVRCTGDGDKIQRPLKKPLSPLGQFSPQVHASTSRKLLSRDKDRMEWKGRETERETAAEFIAHVRIPVPVRRL